MTERQEIRVKALELAIGTLQTALGTFHSIPKGVTEEQARVFTDGAIALAKHFEEFILKAP
jgi:gamma-glutamylcysteine synthetase